ncbi:type II DNA topoisomerase [Rhizodiscina lignyota]|uniref:DNA topoisomerase 2 n=1 Tax=Rhizodiscina lignyota TaxID=1504668 RepID=A0A9P4IJL7_9PEZI|nr:type II DNA topoisomerase [Rhizodiscina lignyota]
MDDSLMNSVFEDDASSDFAPKPKAKAKAAPKKAAAAPKAKAGAKKLTQSTLKTTKTAKKRAKPDSDAENTEDEEPVSFHDASLLSNTPPSSKKQKKAPAPKKAGGKPLQEIANESFGMDGTSDPKPAKGSSSDKYQRLTQLEHIIKRPDTYIGSIERDKKQMWAFNSSTDLMENREVSYVPGLYKIFDEILVNAADNKHNDKNMNEIRVTVDRESGQISVWNNGRGIPIEVHKKEGIYIPEMIFGHLLTSSNYDDNQQKVTGGRNGYGAKLCNIFSVKFTVETADARQKKFYKQTWTANMSKMGDAIIEPYKGDDYTKVTFTPDYAKFGMDGMDDDFEALVKRRIYDLAGTVHGVILKLNNVRIKVNNFKKYMEMYTKAIKAEQGAEEDGEGAPKEQDVIITEKVNDEWEVGFAVSDGSFQQVSFVNSIATTSGGSHVNYVADQIVTKLMEAVKKKNKGGFQLKPHQIKNHIFLFVNCAIVNPAFTSQTKEQLTTKPSQFGTKCEVSEKFLKAIEKTQAVSNILHFAQKKADQVLSKSDGSKRSRMNNSKLTDANRAGTKDGWRCTLILTEGDSASGLALAGRSVVNPDLIGVFPLRGKLLNVRDASLDQITKNQEIQNIKKFMGLQHKKEYTDTRSLRYGHLMIMTDQDHDGSHIKGLLINFFECNFPSLLKIPDFLNVFITPIVKVWKGDPKAPRQLKSFFTMPEYEAWKEEPGHQKGWDHKYYKGLGTSTSDDAEVYFRDLDRHLKEFEPMKREEAEMIDLAFSKKKADARKNWLRDYQPGTYLDMSAKSFTYDDFVNKELILFSIADNLRSIPSVIDGLKPSQRKVLYTCFRRNLKKDIKVVELAGSVMGLTNYAYGESSMQQTITGLAQTFVGSNNVNCLEPSGNFGSRRMGGADAASPRYIYTRLSPFARKIFNQADEPLLTYHEDDGATIEPHNYVPVVPMLLLNGADGIGTGWSTSIPNYKPEDIVENLKRRMAGTSKEDMVPMTPWFRGYVGQTEDMGQDRFKFTGIIRQTGDNEVEITELPVRMWTQDFKDKLEEILKAEKVPSFIKDYVEYNTPTKVHFIIKLEDKHMKIAVEKGLEETFKLTKSMATSNLVAFDAQGRLHKYETPLDMMEEFYHVRLKFYEKRKQYLLDELQKDLDKLSNQSRFIKMIIDGSLIVSKRKKKDLVAELKKLNFRPFPKVADARKEGEFENVVENEDSEESEETAVGANDYDYLLGMAIWSLTQERVDKLLKQIGDKETEIDMLIKLTPKDIWTKDLDDFLNEWYIQLDDEKKRTKKFATMGRRASAKLGIEGKADKRKKRDNDDSDFEVSKKKAKPKANSLTDYFSKYTEPTAAKPKTVGKKDAPLVIDGAADTVDEEAPKKKTAAPKKEKAPAAKAAGKPKKTAKPAIPTPSEEDDEDVFAEVAKEETEKPKAPTQPVRAARAASKKPVKYDLPSDDSDSDGNDMLGDVSTMVKGIGGNPSDATANRALFSASAQRPTSSHALSAKAKERFSSHRVVDLSDDDVDMTDYTKLVPQGSPQRPAARTANEIILSEDEDSMDIAITKPKAKPVARTNKAAAKPTAKATTKKAAAAPAPKKPAPLSPAAKAYAAKQAKAAAAKPMSGETDESDDDDANDLVNDLLSDDSSPAPAPSKKADAAPAAGRPGRRAAATKSKYVISDDESASESEASFEEDDDDSFD